MPRKCTSETVALCIACVHRCAVALDRANWNNVVSGKLFPRGAVSIFLLDETRPLHRDFHRILPQQRELSFRVRIPAARIERSLVSTYASIQKRTFRTSERFRRGRLDAEKKNFRSMKVGTSTKEETRRCISANRSETLHFARKSRETFDPRVD